MLIIFKIVFSKASLNPDVIVAQFNQNTYKAKTSSKWPKAKDIIKFSA